MVAAFEPDAFECLAFEAGECAEVEEEEEVLRGIYGQGGGGGYIWKRRRSYNYPTKINPPRLSRHKPELLPPRREFDPGKIIPVELPSDEEENRVARWQAFRALNQSSYPEFICYEWLVNKKKLRPGLDFQFQYPFLGGRTQFGGFVLDFFFPIRRMAWFIQGLHFHYTNAKDRGRDQLAVFQVASRGVDVVEIFEDDIIQRTEYTLERAWLGQSIKRLLS